MTNSAAVRRHPKTSRRALKENITAYVMLTPQLIGFVLFGLLPILIVIYVAFCNWNVLGAPKFAGWKGFMAEFMNKSFRIAMWNSMRYALMLVPAQMLLAFMVAILLNKIAMKTFFRAMYFMPVVTSSVAVAMIWNFIYNPNLGVLNYILYDVLRIGGERIQWLGGASTALQSIVIMRIWGGLGYTMVLFLAGLQSISCTYYEAALIDGASEWQKIRYITLPLISPTTFFIAITSIIGSFQLVAEPMLLTLGGPQKSTYPIAYHIYQRAFQDMEMGRACAASLVLFVIVMAITGVQFLVSKYWVNYDQ